MKRGKGFFVGGEVNEDDGTALEKGRERWSCGTGFVCERLREAARRRLGRVRMERDEDNTGKGRSREAETYL
jgi:hypothetical protein